MTRISSCNKTADIDITEYSWELKSINMEAKLLKNLKEKKFHHPNAYILTFKSDSVLWLSISVNMIRGRYFIPDRGTINIVYYGEHTQVGDAADRIIFNDKLLKLSIK